MTNNMYLATRTGLLICHQEQGVWQVRERLLHDSHVTSVIAREGVILAGTTAGIQRSDDGGDSWRVVNAGLTSKHVREYEEAVALRGKGDPKPEKPKPRKFEMTTYSTVFGYVRNGMRFPTEVRTERREYLVPGDDIDDPKAGHRMFLVLQTFDRYRFFGVRTAEQVTEIVLGQVSPD